MDEDTRRAVALFALRCAGPVGQRAARARRSASSFRAAASRDWVMPSGRVVRISARTIEAWYYRYRSNGLAGLAPGARSDSGTSRSMSAEVADLVLRAKREKPRRSIRRIIRMLERAGRVQPGELSRSSVHRLLSREGISWRPTRAQDEQGEATWVVVTAYCRAPFVACPGGHSGCVLRCSLATAAAGRVVEPIVALKYVLHRVHGGRPVRAECRIV
jgi:transposase